MFRSAVLCWFDVKRQPLTCLECGDDNVLLLREFGGLHMGDDFSRPLASDWLRLSGEAQESMSERRGQISFLLIEICCSPPKAPCNIRRVKSNE